MGILEIVLLGAGAIIFLVSFCIPVKQEKLKEEAKKLAAHEVKELVTGELENVRGRLIQLSEEEMQEQIRKSERSMERISNEKIMAVGEYSDTVLNEIHKNHEEVVFLYDMLKNKKESLSKSYDTTDKNLQELLQQVKDSEITVRENLEEISDKQKEIEALQAKTASHIVAAQKAIEAQQEKAISHIAKVQEELEAQQEEVAGSIAAAQQKIEDLQTKAASHIAEAQKELEAQQEKEEKEVIFRPFTPEKVEVIPKKRVARKPLKEQSEVIEEEDRPARRHPEMMEEEDRSARRRPEMMEEEDRSLRRRSEMIGAKDRPARRRLEATDSSAVENAEVMLLLSDTMEKKAKNSNERILELHRAGKSNMAIARDLGLGIGEVKLVIDLYKGLW